MIYSRGGEPITLARKATVDEVMTDWGYVRNGRTWRCAGKCGPSAPKADLKQATERVGYNCMWWATHEDGTVRLVDAAMCRADGGWGEISDTINGTNEGSGT